MKKKNIAIAAVCAVLIIAAAVLFIWLGGKSEPGDSANDSGNRTAVNNDKDMDQTGGAEAVTGGAGEKPTAGAEQDITGGNAAGADEGGSIAGTQGSTGKRNLNIRFNSDGTVKYLDDSTFYTDDVTLTLMASGEAQIYYTMDGSTPGKDSIPYTEPLLFKAKSGSFPDAYVIRAKAFFADGTESGIAARTYIVADEAAERFSTLVFSVSGNPAELTESPDGIFTGENYVQRGRESERAVYVEAWDADGREVFSQFAGVRIYGGASREASVKSMKLFARRSYDPDYGTFKLDSFGTKKLDGSDKVIKKYDKLVLRNSGNDAQFAFIRDELSQTLAKQAGFDCYEAVLPAAVYLNGSYYGFFWLHENYCDRYFKEKFGDAEGEFVVIEGSERGKNDDDDELTQACVDEYNEFYSYITGLDITNDKNFSRLNEFMDVYDYLNFFAWNIAINNWDWPNNNYKCYKYVGVLGDAQNEGVYDGRWRFLPHDMDFTYGLYDSDTTQANYNSLAMVLDSNHERYAPLFAGLMEREDCRQYFKEKTYEFIDSVLSPDNIVDTYTELHESRIRELEYFYDYMERLRRKGDWSIWARPEHYEDYEEQIRDFAEERAEYVAEYLERLLP